MARRGRADLRDLLAAGVVQPGETIVGRHAGRTYKARITGSGRIEVSGRPKITGSLSKTASTICGYEYNGWNFWKVSRGVGKVTLAELREGAAGGRVGE